MKVVRVYLTTFIICKINLRNLIMKLIVKANKTLKVKNKQRYKFHLSPNSGWSNDPNGLVFFKGKYHVFFQNNPFETDAKKIFWGHFVSDDLIKWRQTDFALAPDKPYDIDGCFSGSAIVFDGKLVLAYTGHKNVRSNYKETICIATSKDGFNFQKSKDNPVIERNPQINTRRFRDPKIFRKNGKFYILVGGESLKGKGQLLLYESDNLYSNWHYIRKLMNKNALMGNMIECPDYFDVSGKKVIICSPKGLKTDEKHGFTSLYYLNNFDFAKGALFGGKQIDLGWDFYAPQTLDDQIHERRILFGWFGLPSEQEKEKKLDYKSIGALTLPRKIIRKGSKLFTKPIAECARLREKEPKEIRQNEEFSVTSEFVFEKFDKNFLIKISSDEAKYIINYQKNNLTIKIQDKLRNHKNKIKNLKNNIKLDLFIDNGLTELFVNNGEFVFSNKCEFLSEKIRIYFKCNQEMIGFNYELKKILK